MLNVFLFFFVFTEQIIVMIYYVVKGQSAVERDDIAFDSSTMW